MLACPGCALLEKLKIDDPVGCVPTHGFAGIWGLVAVALFAERDTLENRFSSNYGVLKGGPWRFLGVQLLLIVSTGLWAAIMTFLELFLVDKIIGLRMSLENEMLGADLTEHTITHEDRYETNETMQNGSHNVEPETEEANAEVCNIQTVNALCSSQNPSHEPKQTVFQKTISRVGWKRKSVTFQSQNVSSVGQIENGETLSNFKYRNGGFVNEGHVQSQENLNCNTVERTEADLREI